MLTAPLARTALKLNPNLTPIILGYSTHFEIAIAGESIAHHRIDSLPSARRFKTLTAAYSYIRTFLYYKGDVLLRFNDK
jgi:hypothetical protein